MEYVALVAITRNTILVYCSQVTATHLQIGHRVPDLQMSCSDFTLKIGHQDSSLDNDRLYDIPVRSQF